MTKLSIDLSHKSSVSVGDLAQSLVDAEPDDFVEFLHELNERFGAKAGPFGGLQSRLDRYALALAQKSGPQSQSSSVVENINKFMTIVEYHIIDQRRRNA